MSRRARALAAAVALALAAAQAFAGGAAPGLTIAVGTPLFAGSDLVVEVRQGGALAGRELAVQVAVDGVAVGRFVTGGGSTELRVASPPLAAGRHEILVKSGSHRAAVEVRVWPRWSLYAPAVAAAALGALVVARLRRRRDRAV